MAKIAIIGGGGYVGLAYAAAFSHLGHEVIGLDVDAAKVRKLERGESPIFEPGLHNLLRRGLANGRLRFTTRYDEAVPEAEFVFICVGTPADDAGRARMQHVVAAAKSIGPHLRGHTIIVNKSTMPIGSAELVAGILGEHAGRDATFDVVSNPEFLREGSAVHDIFHPDRIVLGAKNDDAAQRVAGLYQEIGAPVVIADPSSAEMIKYASNAFLAAKISFINEVAHICEALGADISVVAKGMGLDERIGPGFLHAGAGFGGSCFPKDVAALASMARETGQDPAMLTAVLAINTEARQQLVDKLAGVLGDLAGKTVAMLGLAFKPETDDVREAPSLDLIRTLVEAGAQVRATDPIAIGTASAALADLDGVTYVADPYEAAMGADAVMLVTEWDAYRALDFDHLANAMRGEVIVDGRNALDGRAVAAAGLTWIGVGKPMMMPVRLLQRARPSLEWIRPAMIWAAAD